MPGGIIRVEDLSGDTSPCTYAPPHPTYLYYYTDYGVWRRTTGNGKWEFDDDEERDNYRPTFIRECGIPISSLADEEPEFKGRHYDALIIDDIPMGSTSSSPEEVRRTTEWYGTQYHLNPEYMEEVKGKMLQLIDVIFFNRKTKVIEYHKEIVAINTEEAYMLAAQDYGKFNPKVHVRHAHCLFGFDEDDKE